MTLGTNPLLGIVLALAGAVLLALGTQFQNRGVTLGEPSSGTGTGAATGLSLRQLRRLLTRPEWVVGTVFLGAAIVLQLTSLTVAQLIVVQPLGVVALVITAVLNARLSGVPLDRTSVRAIVLCVGGVGIFVTVASVVGTENPVTSTQLRAVLIVLAVALVASVVAFAVMRSRRPRPIFYVVAGGVLFGFVVTLVKVVIVRVQTIVLMGFAVDSSDILTLLCLVGLAAAGLLGSYFVQTAHSLNPPDLVVAGLTVIDPLVAVSISIVVLGEADGAPVWAMVLFVVAAATAIGGVLSLARHHPRAHAPAAPDDLLLESR